MRSLLIGLALILGLCATPSSAQLPLNPINCGSITEPPILDYPLGPLGTYKVLWVMCAPDSGALAPLDNLPIRRATWCSDSDSVHGAWMDTIRVMYPSTYSLPPWSSEMLDIERPNSLARYYSETSFERFWLIGDVVGETDSTIFLSDPDTSVRPLQPYTCWGNDGGPAFFLNIMSKVDSVVDFSDYDLDDGGFVDFLVFDIYGLAEDGNFQGTGGISVLPASYTSHDTTSDGDSIVVSDGCVIWSPSPEAYIEHRGFSQDYAEVQSYWETHGIAAHEVGHRIGGFTTHRSFLGCYEIMGPNGNFVNPETWITGPTSPYNPDYRLNFGWIDPMIVDRPNFSMGLEDHLSSGALLKLPAYRTTEGDDQYFLALASTRVSTWERFFPSDGVMIYHITPGGGGAEANESPVRKWIDMELSSGLYDWETAWRDADPSWGCVGCTLWTGTNLQTENVISGLDSFDFNWVMGDTYPRETFWGGHWGTRSNYFAEGDTFNYNSNPTSHAHDDVETDSQSRPTMVHVAVSDVDTSTQVCTITAWSRHWRGTVTQDVVWLDSVVVDSSVAIAFNARLTILPGTEVVIDNNASITIGGSLNALGTFSQPITFRAKDAGERWNGLTIVGGSVEMDYVNLQEFKDHGIYVESPVAPVSINHTDFDCSKLKYNGIGLQLWNSPTVTQVVQNSAMYSVPSDSHVVGMNLYNCKLDFDNVTIEDSDWINSLIKKTSGSFTNCVFRDRAQNYAVLFTTAPNTPNFRCCTFENLAPFSGTWPTTIYCSAGTTPSFGAEGDVGDGASCTIVDSSDYLLTMSGSYSLPIVDSDPPVPPQYGSSNGGHNNWIQNDTRGKFFRNLNEGSSYLYPCTEQYWLPSTSAGMYRPTGIWDYDPVATTAWPECGGGTGSAIHDGPLTRDEDGTLDDGEYDVTMNEALQFEQAEDYAAAQELFRYVAENTSDTTQRWNALAHIVVCESFTLGGGSWLPELVDDMIEQQNTYESRVLGERLRASFYQNREEYDAAIETCVNLLGSGLTFEDSIQVAMDLVGIQSSIGEGAGSSLDGMSATHMIPASLRAETSEEVLQIERELFALLSPNPEQPKVSASIPVEFKLYPNHPNPFNPTTQIEFDIPEALPVTLTVFNSLGQIVATIVDKPLQAGHHTVTWDGTAGNGSEVATGLYIYQIKAGQFMDSKKMVLMR